MRGQAPAPSNVSRFGLLCQPAGRTRCVTQAPGLLGSNFAYLKSGQVDGSRIELMQPNQTGRVFYENQSPLIFSPMMGISLRHPATHLHALNNTHSTTWTAPGIGNGHRTGCRAFAPQVTKAPQTQQVSGGAGCPAVARGAQLDHFKTGCQHIDQLGSSLALDLFPFRAGPVVVRRLLLCTHPYGKCV